MTMSLGSVQNVQGRILIISDAAPHRNGVGAYYADLAEDLRSSVSHVEIVSPEIIAGKWTGGWMLPLPGDNTQKFCLPNGFELQRKIRKFLPTVVIVPTPGLFGLVGAMLARKEGIKVIVGFHTWFEKLSCLYWNKIQGGLTKTYFDWVNKALFRLSDLVLANSQEMVEIAQKLGAPNVQLMGTPLSQSLIDKPVSRIPKAIKRVLFVGRLAAEKNLEAIVEAAKKNPELEFTIAGDGPERDKLQQAVWSLTNIHLLGWVDREAVVSLIDDHDLLVLPSTVESFGTVAMEAMMRQRMVVVSSACGIVNWSDLRQGLHVIAENSDLGQEVRAMHDLSEFEIYRRCNLARHLVFEHMQWNRALWMSCCGLSSPTNQGCENEILNKPSRVWS